MHYRCTAHQELLGVFRRSGSSFPTALSIRTRPTRAPHRTPQEFRLLITRVSKIAPVVIASVTLLTRWLIGTRTLAPGLAWPLTMLTVVVAVSSMVTVAIIVAARLVLIALDCRLRLIRPHHRFTQTFIVAIVAHVIAIAIAYVGHALLTPHLIWIATALLNLLLAEGHYDPIVMLCML